MTGALHPARGARALRAAPLRRTAPRGVLAVAAACALACGALAPRRSPPDAAACVPAGTWLDPASGRVRTWPQVLRRVGAARVLLLGERHDAADDHRWQLSVLGALLADGRPLVVGVEMLPRRTQPALDRWLAGTGDERGLLRDVDWEAAWGVDAAPYLPLFHFARLHRLPMVALNVERRLVARVGEQGWAAVPRGDREGVADPAPPADAYVARLREVWREQHAGAATDDAAAARFVEAQLLWDRAMAEALAGGLRASPDALVVGIVGRGHAEYGHGIPHQLRALGVPAVVVLLPWDAAPPCPTPPPDVADAVFGLVPSTAPPPRRLGVTVAAADGGVRIAEVSPGGVGAAAGLRAGDVVVSAAGRGLRSAADLRAVVGRQPPGSCLPLRVRRGGRVREVVARFPADE
jgi:uncharacterized iron-regulated protein